MVLTIEHTPPATVHLDDAFATPFAYDSTSRNIKGCLYDCCGRVVVNSQRTSGVGGDRVQNSDPDQLISLSPAREIYGAYVYLGHFMAHYGHFLLETISTFWYLIETENRNVAFHPFIFGSKSLPFMDVFFNTFGLDFSKALIIREAVIFKRVSVPERTFRLNHSANKYFLQTINKIKSKLRIGQKMISAFPKVYFSRSSLMLTDRSVTNQIEVDEVMESLGYKVVHPERISVVDQIRLVSDCQIIAGFSGSALHNILFGSRGLKLIEIGDLRSTHKPLPAQILCNLLIEADAEFIPFKRASDDMKTAFDTVFLREQIRRITSRVPG